MPSSPQLARIDPVLSQLTLETFPWCPASCAVLSANRRTTYGSTATALRKPTWVTVETGPWIVAG